MTERELQEFKRDLTDKLLELDNNTRIRKHQADFYFNIYNEMHHDNPELYGVRRMKKEVFTTCGSCVIRVLNALRAYVDLPAVKYKLDPVARKERLRICRGDENTEKCEFYISNILGGNCRKCFCFIYAKAAIPGESCPVGKW